MFHKYMNIFLLLCFCCWTSAEVFTVTTKDDVIEEDGELSLREAIGRSNGNGETNNIVFAGVSKITIDDELGEIDIDDNNVIIHGQVTLSGNKRSRIFSISNGSVVELENIEFEDGFTDDDGGAIIVDAGCTLQLTNCIFEKNISLNSGGAIQIEGSLVSCINCLFRQNETTNNGGAINIVSDAASGDIVNSAFDSNSCAGNGGAINILGDGGDGSVAKISNSNFVGNSSTNGDGGAIAIDNNGSVGTINQCVFAKNECNSNGGAVFNAGDITSIFNTFFQQNEAAVNGGGYFDNGASNSEFAACVFDKNEAATGAGGAVNIAVGSNVVFDECFFTNNEAAANGGGVFNDATVEIIDCTFEQNASGNNGAGLFNNENADVSIQRTLFNKNQADNQGGGTYGNNDSTFLAVNCTYSANSAKNDGGGHFDDDSADTEFSFCTITLNSAKDDGGGVFINTNSNVELNNCLVQNNKAGEGKDLFGDNFVDGGFNLIKSGVDNNFQNGVNDNIVGNGINVKGLKDNGGAVETHAIGGGTKAVDAANPDTAGVVVEDARGFLREDGANDIGSFEFDGTEPLPLLAAQEFSVEAKKTSESNVVTWKIAKKYQNVLGFNIWRRISKERGYKKVNALMITAQGETMSYTDLLPQNDKRAYYKIEVIMQDMSKRFVKRVSVKK